MPNSQNIELLIGEIHGIVKSHDITLRNIEAQTQKTNGRVTSLEKTVETLAKVESTNSGLIKANQDNIRNLEEDRNNFKKAMETISAVLSDIKKDHNEESTDKRRSFIKIKEHGLTSIITLLLGWIGFNITK